MLMDIGVSKRLAYHFASLFVRAPIPVYEKDLDFDSSCNPSPKELTPEKKKRNSDEENLQIEKGDGLCAYENDISHQNEIRTSFKEKRSAIQTALQSLSPDDVDDGYTEKVSSDVIEDHYMTLRKLSLEEKQMLQDGVKTSWFVKCPPIHENAHFENIQSTNWNALRFKNPPTMDTDIGWRVEFRPMDILLTDYENAAMTVITGMIANIVTAFDLDFILPISLVDENMNRAHARDAVLT